MDNIEIAAGENSPLILMDSQKRILTINGNSYMSGPSQFYHRLSSWAQNLKIPMSKCFEINITMGYYNTTSIQIINIMLKTICLNNPGKVNINFMIDKEEDELTETALALVQNTKVKPNIVNEFREGDIRHCFADISKIKKLGFSPKISFEQGMKELVSWGEGAKFKDRVEVALSEMRERNLIKK